MYSIVSCLVSLANGPCEPRVRPIVPICSTLVSALVCISWIGNSSESMASDLCPKRILYTFLGDNPSYSRTWSAFSGKLPCFRRNTGFYVERTTGRVLTPTDKITALGWPTTSEAARNMLTTVLPTLDEKRSGLMAGNAMLLGNCAIVMLVGLCCFKAKGNTASPVEQWSQSPIQQGWWWKYDDANTTRNIHSCFKRLLVWWLSHQDSFLGAEKIVSHKKLPCGKLGRPLSVVRFWSFLRLCCSCCIVCEDRFTLLSNFELCLQEVCRRKAQLHAQ